MPYEILISPQLTPTQLAALTRQAIELDRLLDNPYSGPQPIAQTSVLERFGSLLWDASGLKVDDLLAAIDQARDDAASVRLTITNAALYPLPWELLYHQHPQLGFLGRHASCVIARRFAGAGQKPPKLLPKPFRLLLFIASPEDLDAERGRLDFEREEELLFTALDRPLSKGELVIDVAEDGCLPTLLQRLEEHNYHAVILSMHGAQARNQQGQSEWGLLFEDVQTGRSAPVAGSILATELERLPQHRHPGLLLSACRSAKSEESADSIMSAARQLHERGFERVLGMRLSLLDGAASAFSAELFRRLVSGDESVGRAVTLARDTVGTGAWLTNNEGRGKGHAIGDVYAQWTLPVLLDRTADGPLVDRNATFTSVPQPALPTALPGDETIPLPSRASFVGRRSFLRQHLRPFLNGKNRGLLLTGPGGVGKTTLAGLFMRTLQERQHEVRLLGFQAPFNLEAIYEPLRQAAFDGAEEPTLLERLGKTTDRREQIRLLLTSLAARPQRPCSFVLDNLESLQELETLEVTSGHADSHEFVRAVCALPAPTRVLLTGRYRFPQLPAHVQPCPVPDAPYGDVLLRMNRLQWPQEMGPEKKRWIYQVLGGNHRAIEWTAQLLTGQPQTGTALLEELTKLQAPPETPEAMVEVVRESMRQNLLFATLRRQLTPTQDRLLRAACLLRVPVNADGLLALEFQLDQATGNRMRLVDYALLEPVYDPEIELEYFLVPPIVKNLLDSAFSPAELQALHRAIGYYHRFQAHSLSRRLSDDLEAIYHLRQAGAHEEADSLAKDVCNFYYRISNYAAASALAAEIVHRDVPPPPWWALNRYGMCQLTLGKPQAALAAFERALPVALNKEDEGTTLNNLSQIYDARGDYDTALRYLEQSLQIRRDIGDKAGLITILHNMAHIALQAEDFERALTLWSEALSLAMETGNAQGIFHVARTVGTLLAQAGHDEEAENLLGLAIRAGRQAGFPGVEETEETMRQVQARRGK